MSYLGLDTVGDLVHRKKFDVSVRKHSAKDISKPEGTTRK